MSDTAPITQDPVTNQFLPGNIWRFRKGQSGHPARYNYKSLRLKVIEHVEHVLTYTGEFKTIAHQTLTWAGLARHLGMSTDGLAMYRDGQIGNDKPAIVAMLKYYKTLMEEQKEGRLEDKDFSTAGVIFSLKHHHGWEDKTIMDIQQQISISLDPDSALAKRLNGAGVTIDQPLDTLE